MQVNSFFEVVFIIYNAFSRFNRPMFKHSNTRKGSGKASLWLTLLCMTSAAYTQTTQAAMLKTNLVSIRMAQIE